MAKFVLPEQQMGRNFYTTTVDQSQERQSRQNYNPATNGSTGRGTAPANRGASTNAAANAAQKQPKTTTYTVNAGNQPYVDQLNALYDQIMNRKPFQYDLNGDLLYRQMADRYTQMGKMAMRDATGTAAGLTGGYGNSYANQVGNQAYQQYLTALNDNIPSLYQQALNAYLAEGEQLMEKYQTAAAHPGYLEAIKPRTYTVTQKEEETEQATLPDALNTATYGALLASMLNGGQAGVTPYQSNGATTDATPATTYNVPANPTAESQIYQYWLQQMLGR